MSREKSENRLDCEAGARIQNWEFRIENCGGGVIMDSGSGLSAGAGVGMTD